MCVCFLCPEKGWGGSLIIQSFNSTLFICLMPISSSAVHRNFYALFQWSSSSWMAYTFCRKCPVPSHSLDKCACTHTHTGAQYPRCRTPAWTVHMFSLMDIHASSSASSHCLWLTVQCSWLYFSIGDAHKRVIDGLWMSTPTWKKNKKSSELEGCQVEL